MTKRVERQFNIRSLFEEVWRNATFRPIEELKPPIPRIRRNPRLRRSIARIKMSLLPAKIKEGRILEYPRVVNPVIETSPLFETLSRNEQKRVIKHEIAHLIMQQAMPRTRQIHREGSLFSMEKVIMKASELKGYKRRRRT